MSRAFRVFTSAGSKFIMRFDPKVMEEGITYGRAVVIGYSEVAQKKIRITGIAAEPEVGSNVIITDRAWSIERFGEEEVPLYEYETVSQVEEIDIERLRNESKEAP